MKIIYIIYIYIYILLYSVGHLTPQARLKEEEENFSQDD